MDSADFDHAVCLLARQLYRLDPGDLDLAEEKLRRLLGLLAHYRRVARGGRRPDAGAGAAHLCRPAG